MNKNLIPQIQNNLFALGTLITDLPIPRKKQKESWPGADWTLKSTRYTSFDNFFWILNKNIIETTALCRFWNPALVFDLVKNDHATRKYLQLSRRDIFAMLFPHTMTPLPHDPNFNKVCTESHNPRCVPSFSEEQNKTLLFEPFFCALAAFIEPRHVCS